MTDRYERALNVVAADVPSPEDVLIAREGSDEEQGSRSWQLERKLLKKLPAEDQELLLLTYGQDLSTWKIGRLKRISHQAVQKRLASARARLAWLRGPGRLFTAIDLHRALRWRMLPEDVAILRIYWRRRSIVEVARTVGLNEETVRKRLTRLIEGDLVRLTEEDPDTFGRFLRGFRALRAFMLHKGCIFSGM